MAANFYGPGSGGLRTTLHALARGYSEAGHEPVMLVPGERLRVETTDWGRRISLPSRSLPGTGGYRIIVDLPLVRRMLAGVQPDRLEVSDRATLRDLGSWAQAQRVPSIVWAHERLDGVLAATVLRGKAGAAVAARVADVHNRRTAALFDRVVVTTSFAAQEFERVGVPTTRVPLGVDLEAFHPRRHDPQLRAGLVPDDEVLLVLCSRLSPEKRPELALQALQLLVAAGHRCHLVVAGSGPLEDSLRHRFAHLPVRWLGFVSDRDALAALLATADVVVAPGPLETFGLAALEALASGTPVVATRGCALPEVVGSAGAFADPTGAGLAGAITEVLGRHPRLRRGLARRRACELPWSATVERMLAVHADLSPRPLAVDASPVAPGRLPATRAAALVRASTPRGRRGVGSSHALGDGPRVLGLGDSISAGVGDLVEPGRLPGWAAHVADAVQAASYRNLARLGARARSVRDEQLAPALAWRPDLVLLSVAGNDALRGDLDLADVARSVEHVVGTLTAGGGSVVVLRPPALDHVGFLPARLHRALHARLTLVGGEVARATEAAGGICIALPAGRDAAPQPWHVDRIHPGPGGHRWAATAALQALGERGYRIARPVAPVVTAPPSRAAEAGWLLRNGVPWVLKRSVDLVPALLVSTSTTATPSSPHPT
jgi:alpha-1,6-mannosyltransferase